jgi:predicted pyridoxine 5'-phosphate oxidase superfamily flavin-nucleotide-binding protein
MAALPTTVTQAWESRNGPIVLTTVDAQGVPNAIYATCVRRHGDDGFVVADNFFSKTRDNIMAGSVGSLLFITEEGKAYQIKGSLEYLTEGEIFDEMKRWNNAKLPGHAAVVLTAERVYSGATQLL